MYLHFLGIAGAKACSDFTDFDACDDQRGCAWGSRGDEGHCYPIQDIIFYCSNDSEEYAIDGGGILCPAGPGVIPTCPDGRQCMCIDRDGNCDDGDDDWGYSPNASSSSTQTSISTKLAVALGVVYLNYNLEYV